MQYYEKEICPLFITPQEQYNKDNALLCFTEHWKYQEDGLCAQIFKAEHYAENTVDAKDTWMDWAYFQHDTNNNSNGDIPGQLQSFVQLPEQTLGGKSDPSISGYDVELPGLFCIMTRFKKAPVSNFMQNASDPDYPKLKFVSKFIRWGDLLMDNKGDREGTPIPARYIVSCENINGPACVIPNTRGRDGEHQESGLQPNRNTSSRADVTQMIRGYLVVDGRHKWEEHFDDLMSQLR